MHNSCWNIVCLRLCDCDTSVVAKNLFYVLLSTTYNCRGWPSPGHDFGGAVQFHKLVGDPIRAANAGSWSLLYADPDHRALLQLEALPCYLPEVTLLACPSEAGRPADTAHWQSEERSFSQLPIEVIHLILAWLPSNDIAKLRLASRTIKCALTVKQLPQAFWSSRFTPNLEMGFAKPTHSDHHPLRNWRDFFFTVRHTLRTPDGHLPLKNRRRVWNLLGPTSDVLQHLSRHRPVCGVPFAWNDLSPLLQHWEGPSRPELGRIITGEVVNIDQQELMDIGCRELHVRGVVWPVMSCCSGCTIAISLISFNYQTFISGICVVPSNQTYSREIDRNSTLGVTNPPSETQISLQAAEHLQGFEVAVKASGIVGLRLLIGGVQDRCSEWVGDIGTGGPEVAIGRLIPGAGRRIFALAAGFDVHHLLLTISCTKSKG